MTNEKKLSPIISIGWAIGELAIAAFVVIQMAYMLYYCTEALHIPPALAGLALMIPRLLDAFADPLMGSISDRTKNRFGRRRLFLLIGAPFLGLSFALVFFVPPDVNQNLKIIILLITFLLSNAAVTIYEVPYSAMAAEMTGSYKERTTLAGYKMLAARLGGVIAAFAAPKIFGSTPDLDYGFRILGVSCGIFMCFTGLWAFFATKHAHQTTCKVKVFSLSEEIAAVKNNQSFRKLWGAFFIQNLAIGAQATALIYFIVQVIQIPPKDAGQFMSSGAIAALIATPIWVLFGKKIGKKNGYYIGIIGSLILAIPALFLGHGHAQYLLLILIIAGFTDAATQLFPNAMVPDTVEADELKTGLRREGAIFGAWGFARKLGMTGGAFIVSQLLSLIHFKSGVNPSLQPPEVIFGIRMIYVILPSILWAIAFFALMKYDLNEDRFEQIKREINSQRSDN